MPPIQLQQAINTKNPLVTLRISAPVQRFEHLWVPAAWILLDYLLNRLNYREIVVRLWLVAIDRPTDTQQLARRGEAK